jgi:hypothetical protein
MREGLVMLKYFLLFMFSSYALSHDQIFEGKYTYGNEVSIFQECNGEKVYWLEGSGFLISDVKALALKGDKPYTAIYLKFRGHEHFEEVDGFQADYDYQIHVSEVKEYDAKMPEICN